MKGGLNVDSKSIQNEIQIALKNEDKQIYIPIQKVEEKSNDKANGLILNFESNIKIYKSLISLKLKS